MISGRSFSDKKKIKANIKKIITKLYIPEKYKFPRKYYIKSKNHRSQMEAYILKSKFHQAKPKLPEIIVSFGAEPFHEAMPILF